MQSMLSTRIWYFFVALACAALLGYGFYVQHVDFLDPCPLCVFQRVAFMWMGAVALIAALHNPSGVGRWVYGSLVLIGGVTGAGIAWRHVWLQSLPPDQVPDCGMGLNYMVETMPFTDVLKEVFYGSGECAEIVWSFMGLSMPSWTLIWFAGLTIMTLLVMLKAPAKTG